MGIRSQIFLIVFGIFFVGIFLSYIVAERDLSKTLENQIVLELRKQAELASISIGPVSKLDTIEKADLVADKIGGSIDSRVTIIKDSGEVLGDSNLSTSQISVVENHSNRPEIIDAKLNNVGWSIRYSDTVNKELLYLALKGQEDVGFIRIAVPYTYVQGAFDGLSLSITLIAIVGLIAAFFSSAIAANFTWNNLRELENATRGLLKDQKKKNLKALPTQRSDEIGSVARDISEISKNLRTQISMIAKQRDQFGSVLDNLGEGVFVTDNDGKITYENDSILSILETSSSVKKNIRDLNIKALKNMFENVDKEGRFDYEFPIELKNGDVKWILGSMNRAKTTNEYILVVHDVTQLRENASMRRDFISNLSHELRTPVSVIFANAETLLDGAIENKKDAKVFSKAIMHNAERISGLVSDLIDLSRIDYGELHLDLKELDVCEIINTVNRSHYTSAKNKGIQIRFDKCNCPHVLGDKAAIERILTNLLDNAIKYSKANNGGEVKITTKVIEDSIKISVKDSGTGISDDDRNFIFNRFYRTPEARASQKSGSGLGLAIVKNLAISLGGKYGARNRNKKNGSIFWFTLPLYAK